MIILPVERRLDWSHAPVALFAIILLNILIFFLYQSGDDQRYVAAVQAYMQKNYLQQEWPHYQEYLTNTDQLDKLHEVQADYAEEAYFELVAELLRDDDFYRYLEDNGPNLFYWDDYNLWYSGRSEIQEQVNSISYLRFGLKPNDLSFADLIVYQFLHGGFMHLLGNMVFLMICGFVVEAAIGHLPFIIFYLLGGVAAGLTHSLMDITSDQPLVGASGAISAVMAMYLVLYRWKRIQFFYWFYVIVGYFRAPALIILPIYIGKELYSYYFDDGSNVAFMAHAGGFVAGSLLIALTAVFKPSVLNNEYLEASDNDEDPYRKLLAEIYDALEKYRFDTAGRLVQKAIKDYGSSFELLLIRHNLLKIARGKLWQKSLNIMLAEKHLSEAEIKIQEKIWRESERYADQIDSDALVNAAVNFTRLNNISSAEKIFDILQQRGEPTQQLVRLANFLAKACVRLDQPQKHKSYQQLAQQMAGI